MEAAVVLDRGGLYSSAKGRKDCAVVVDCMDVGGGWDMGQRKREIATDRSFIWIFECADGPTDVTIPQHRQSHSFLGQDLT